MLRRSFLRVLGLAPVAAATAPAGVLGAVGSRAGVGRLVTGTAGHVAGASFAPLRPATGPAAARFPWRVPAEITLHHRLPHGLDPDLIANQSFSLAAKIMVQRSRDGARSATRHYRHGVYDG